MKTLLITLQKEDSLADYSQKFKSNFGQYILTEVLIDNHYKMLSSNLVRKWESWILLKSSFHLMEVKDEINQTLPQQF